MSSATITIPQDLTIYYPEPASAFVTYMLSGIIVMLAMDIFWDYRGLWQDWNHNIFKRLFVWTLLLVLWPIAIADLYSTACKVIQDNGLKEEYKDKI